MFVTWIWRLVAFQCGIKSLVSEMLGAGPYISWICPELCPCCWPSEKSHFLLTSVCVKVLSVIVTVRFDPPLHTHQPQLMNLNAFSWIQIFCLGYRLINKHLIALVALGTPNNQQHKTDTPDLTWAMVLKQNLRRLQRLLCHGWILFVRSEHLAYRSLQCRGSVQMSLNPDTPAKCDTEL